MLRFRSEWMSGIAHAQSAPTGLRGEGEAVGDTPPILEERDMITMEDAWPLGGACILLLKHAIG